MWASADCAHRRGCGKDFLLFALHGRGATVLLYVFLRSVAGFGGSLAEVSGKYCPFKYFLRCHWLFTTCQPMVSVVPFVHTRNCSRNAGISCTVGLHLSPTVHTVVYSMAMDLFHADVGKISGANEVILGAGFLLGPTVG